ncbi:MAG: hypothetical protein HZA15_15160 [Nitrospirae bacterium]|nr:hypothetical protein [Nitrospirota bacterium]
MADKIVFLCAKKDIINSLKWIFKEFMKQVEIRQLDTPEKLQGEIGPDGSDVLILDTEGVNKSLLEFMTELREQRSSLNTILIISPVTSREEIIEIIKANLVKGIIVRPFTGEVVCKYVEKIFGIQKSGS